jgi:adenosylhomocysteine nucleosidase
MGTAETGRRTWLVVGAERREFSGILKRFGTGAKLDWPAQFARQVNWKGDRWLLVANGPGGPLVEKALAGQALEQKMQVSGMISIGFCGALDPALKVGDIVRADILTIDRVAITAAEKCALRANSGAVAVEMEAAAVARKAGEWGVPFQSIRAVSDTAFDDMPLDFNRYRDREGRFSRSRIALAALARPFTALPALLRLDHNCRLAAEALGEFLANCRF